jgi:hypothetical protein
MAERECPVVPERQDARQWRRVPRLGGEPRRAVDLRVHLVLVQALWVESVSQPVQAQQQVSPRPARSLAREREPSAQLLVREAPELVLSSAALRAQQASPPAQQVPPGQLASQPQAQHSLGEAQQLPLASFAQPSPRHPSLLFLPWPTPLPALPLRRRPESVCALSPRRPPESNSSASSFP